LVVPYEIVHRKDRGETVEEFKAYNDVIVDNVFMEQHTTGIDPFTGRDYGASEFPKEHRYDPQTGLPIFNRYVAGTKERIAWPDEKKEFEEEEAPQTQKDKVVKPSWIRHPIKRWKAGKAQTTTVSTSNETKEAEGLTKAEKEAEKEANELRKSLLEPVRPKSRKAEDQGVYDADTTRNVIEGAESMAYELISPPFPETLKDELRSHLKTRRKDKDDAAPAKKRVQFLTEAGIAAEAKSQGKRDAALKMKTPMQLRWETEQAKKIKQREESPLVSTDDLMAALGKHIEQQRAQKGQKKIAPPRTEELD
jgi:large subunit ribosomal protein L24